MAQEPDGPRLEHQIEALRAIIDERDRRYDQRFEAQQTALKDALAAAEKAVTAALIAADRAVQKAETAAERRFEGVNEFRGQLSDQAATFLPRVESNTRFSAYGERLDAHIKLIDEKISGLASRVDTNSAKLNRDEGRGSGLQAGWGYLLGAIAAVGAIAAMIVALSR